MDQVFVISDIHGRFKMLEKLLTKWQRDEQQLIFLGDYMNRGEDSLRVLQTVKHLVDEHHAIALKGNHEAMFLEWMQMPERRTQMFINIGGIATIQSLKTFVLERDSTIEQLVASIKDEHSHITDWLETLPLYYKWGHYFFVHAGINPYVEQPEHSSEEDLLWIRDEFTQFPHTAAETIVFGHTPTTNLNDDMSGNVWLSPCSKKIGIDGGAPYVEGQLNGIVLTKGDMHMTVYAVKGDELTVEQRHVTHHAKPSSNI